MRKVLKLIGAFIAGIFAAVVGMFVKEYFDGK